MGGGIAPNKHTKTVVVLGASYGGRFHTSLSGGFGAC